MKTYLGDGVYLNYDGYHLVLTAEDGVRVSSTIYIERPNFDALRQYMDKIEEVSRAPATKD